jgi:transcriptional regulatory protein RtcR
MSKSRPLVVIGMLRGTRDEGAEAHRPARGRALIELCGQPHLQIDRLELIVEPRATRVAERMTHEVAEISPGTVVRSHPVDVGDGSDFEHVYGALLDFAATYPFARDREDYLVHMGTGTTIAQICLFLLTQSRHIPGRLIFAASASASASAAASRGFTIIDLDLSTHERLTSRFRREQRAGLSTLKSGIDTRSTRFNRLIEQIEQVARSSRAPLLLIGPNGAGKARLARRIYEMKKARRQVTGAFVELNCATLHGDAAMSTLFGHRKGTFAGALQDRPGLLRTADHGVLFLDEIGELGADEQTMLLRALEYKTFLPLGADVESRSDFQLVAGTNRDLLAATRQGRFREDLLARINLWTFEVPGLAERTEDIAPNVDHELAEFARTDGRVVAFDEEARDHFVAFATSPAARWPGNFRDFNAAIVRMATLAADGRITRTIVDDEIARLQRAWTGIGEGTESLVARLLGPERAAELDRFDRVQLEDVLRVCSGCPTLSEAGRILFSVSRRAKRTSNDADRLRKYLARFGLEWQPVRAMLTRE